MTLLIALLAGFGFGVGFALAICAAILITEYLHPLRVPPEAGFDIGKPDELEEIKFAPDEQEEDTKED